MLEYTCTDLPIQQLTLSLRGVVINAAWQWSHVLVLDCFAFTTLDCFAFTTLDCFASGCLYCDISHHATPFDSAVLTTNFDGFLSRPSGRG